MCLCSTLNHNTFNNLSCCEVVFKRYLSHKRVKISNDLSSHTWRLKKNGQCLKYIYHPRKVVESFKILFSLKSQSWLQALELTHFFLFTQYLHSSFRKKFRIKSFLSIKKTRFTSSKYRFVYLSFLTFLLLVVYPTVWN